MRLIDFLVRVTSDHRIHFFTDKTMFKKFEEKENVSGVTQLKSSVQKGIRNSILETYPDIADYIDNFLPKKDQFKVVKCHDHIELLINSSGDLLFFRYLVHDNMYTDKPIF